MRFFLFHKIGRRILLIITIITIGYILIEGYFSNTISMYTKQRAYLYSTMTVERSLRETIVNDIDLDDIVTLNYKDSSEVSSVSVNTNTANKVLADVLKELTTVVQAIEKNSFNDLKVPLGYFISNTLFSSLGPEIKISLKPIGSVTADIISSVTPTGINNSLLEVILQTKVSFLVLIPLQSHEITVETNIPLVIEILNGEIPRYYYNGASEVVPTTPVAN